MFRQIIVFTRDSNLVSCKAIMQEAKRQQLQCIFFNPFDSPYQELLTQVKSKETLIMPRTSGVLFDDWDLTLLSQCIALGASSTHSPESIRLLRDKDRQYLHFINHDLQCVPTLIHRGPLSLSHLNQFFESKLWVVKANRGNKGIGHQLFDSKELLHFWGKAITRNDQRYLIQPFYEEVEEHRLLVIGNNQYLLRKLPGDSWKKNAGNSEFELCHWTTDQEIELKHIKKKVKETTGIKSFAIDLFFKRSCEKQYEILEVNAHPGMSAASSALKSTNLYEEFINFYLNN